MNTPNTNPRVYIVNGDQSYRRMFADWSYPVVTDPEAADIIVFTGGADVSPELYRSGRHVTTMNNPARDAAEVEIFNRWKGKKAFAGICRGAQFLCVMAGGTLWQDVDNHTASHTVRTWDDRQVLVSSTHHQMQRLVTPDGLALEAEVLASTSISSYKALSDTVFYKQDREPEVVLYHNINALGFQPHPEFFDRNHPCQKLFFECLGKVKIPGDSGQDQTPDPEPLAVLAESKPVNKRSRGRTPKVEN